MTFIVIFFFFLKLENIKSISLLVHWIFNIFRVMVIVYVFCLGNHCETRWNIFREIWLQNPQQNHQPVRHHRRSHRIQWGQEGLGPTTHHAKILEGPLRRWIARWSRSEGQNVHQILSCYLYTDAGPNHWCLSLEDSDWA